MVIAHLLSYSRGAVAPSPFKPTHTHTHTKQSAAQVRVGVMKLYMNHIYRMADPLSQQVTLELIS